MDVFCRGQPLQDVIIVQVVAEKKDFVVHAKETALWELHKGGDTSEEMSEETINNFRDFKPDKSSERSCENSASGH